MNRLKNLLAVFVVLTLSSLPAGAISLWPEHGSVSLFTDNKAHRVGDILTVIVEEEAKVSNSAGSSLSKATQTEGEIETLDWPKGSSASKVFTGDMPKVAFGSTRTFDGEGTYELEDSMETKISAVVLEVLPNGNLVIEGSRVRQSVDEKIVVRISGIVRPEDVRSDNTVLSSVVAQAKFVLEMTGPIARSSKRGFLNRIIDFLWPF